MKRYLSQDTTWWASMLPAFLLAGYFVAGWVERRNDPSTLLSAIGTIAAGVIITCMICAKNERVPMLEIGEKTLRLEPEPLVRPAEVEKPQQQQQQQQLKQLPPQQPQAPHTVSFASTESNPWFIKGMNFATAKQYRDALYCFSYVLQSDPNNLAALTAKGECLMKMNRPEEALKAFMAAAQIDESNPLAKECKEAVLRRVRAATWS